MKKLKSSEHSSDTQDSPPEKFYDKKWARALANIPPGRSIAKRKYLKKFLYPEGEAIEEDEILNSMTKSAVKANMLTFGILAAGGLAFVLYKVITSPHEIADIANNVSANISALGHGIVNTSNMTTINVTNTTATNVSVVATNTPAMATNASAMVNASAAANASVQTPIAQIIGGCEYNSAAEAVGKLGQHIYNSTLGVGYGPDEVSQLLGCGKEFARQNATSITDMMMKHYVPNTTAPLLDENVSKLLAEFYNPNGNLPFAQARFYNINGSETIGVQYVADTSSRVPSSTFGWEYKQWLAKVVSIPDALYDKLTEIIWK